MDDIIGMQITIHNQVDAREDPGQAALPEVPDGNPQLGGMQSSHILDKVEQCYRSKKTMTVKLMVTDGKFFFQYWIRRIHQHIVSGA